MLGIILLLFLLPIIFNLLKRRKAKRKAKANFFTIVLFYFKPQHPLNQANTSFYQDQQHNHIDCC